MEKRVDFLRLKGALVEVALFEIIPASFVECMHFDLLVEFDRAFTRRLFLPLFEGRFRQFFDTLKGFVFLFCERSTERETLFEQTLKFRF
jgi:hypothetical protein